MSEKENSSQIPDSTESLDLNSLTDLNFGPSWAERSSSARKYTPTHIDEKAESSVKKDKRSSARKDRRGSDKFRKKQGTSNFPRNRDRNHFHAPIKDPKFDIKIYPQDDTFDALIKQLKTSCKTYQLFGITRTILEKHERFVVLINRVKKDSETEEPIFFTPKDNLPFDTEEAAIDHFCEHFLGDFFEINTIETEAPKGNFSMIYRCPFTKALIGPPNYHRYQDLLKAHHKSKIKNLSFEAYQSKLEGVNDEAIVNEWLEQMKLREQYCLKSTETHQANQISSDTTDTAESEPTSDLNTETDIDAASNAEDNTVFNTREAAIRHLITHSKESVVKVAHNFRFSGSQIDALPKGILKDSILHTVHTQQRFPLDTANNIRGRLRRHKFTIYKKGPKGISFVCCVKRKFRDQSTVFTDSITQLIQYIEKQSSVDVQNLPFDFLSIPKPSEEKASETKGQLDQANLSEETSEQVKEVLQNLRWLISEGYVTEYSDGTLYVHPLLEVANSQKADKVDTAAKTEVSPLESALKDEPTDEVSDSECSVTQNVTEAEACSATDVENIDISKEPVNDTASDTESAVESDSEKIECSDSPAESA